MAFGGEESPTGPQPKPRPNRDQISFLPRSAYYVQSTSYVLLFVRDNVLAVVGDTHFHDASPTWASSFFGIRLLRINE